jgi:hypothetical protein
MLRDPEERAKSPEDDDIKGFRRIRRPGGKLSTLVEGKRSGTRVPPLSFPDRAMPTFSGIIVGRANHCF